MLSGSKGCVNSQQVKDLIAKNAAKNQVDLSAYDLSTVVDQKVAAVDTNIQAQLGDYDTSIIVDQKDNLIQVAASNELVNTVSNYDTTIVVDQKDTAIQNSAQQYTDDKFAMTQISYAKFQVIDPSPSVGLVSTIAIESTNDTSRYVLANSQDITVTPGIYRISINGSVYEEEKKESELSIEFSGTGGPIDLISHTNASSGASDQQTYFMKTYYLEVPEPTPQVFQLALTTANLITTLYLDFDIMTLSLVGGQIVPAVIDLTPYRLITDSYNQLQITAFLNQKTDETYVDNAIAAIDLSAYRLHIDSWSPAEINAAIDGVATTLRKVSESYSDAQTDAIFATQASLTQLQSDITTNLLSYRLISNSMTPLEITNAIAAAIAPYRLQADSYSSATIDSLLLLKADVTYVDAQIAAINIPTGTKIESPDTIYALEMSNASGGVFSVGGTAKVEFQNSGRVVFTEPSGYAGSLTVPILESDFANKKYVDDEIAAIPGGGGGGVGQIYTAEINTAANTTYTVNHNLNAPLESIDVQMVVEFIVADAGVPGSIGDKFNIGWSNYNGSTNDRGYGLTPFIDSGVADPLNSFKIRTHFSAGPIEIGDGTYTSITWNDVKLHIKAFTNHAQTQDFVVVTDKIVHNTSDLTIGPTGTLTGDVNGVSIVDNGGGDFVFKTDGFIRTYGLAGGLNNVLGFNFASGGGVSNTNVLQLHNTSRFQIIDGNSQTHLDFNNDTGVNRLYGDFTCDTLTELVASSIEYKKFQYIDHEETDYYMPLLTRYKYTEEFRSHFKCQQDEQYGWLWEDANDFCPESCLEADGIKKVNYNLLLRFIVNKQSKLISQLDQRVDQLEEMLSMKRKRRRR